MNLNPFTPAIALAQKPRGLGALEKGKSYTKVRCVVRQAEVKKGKNGDYLQVTIADRTGEQVARSWDGAPLAPQLLPGTVIEIARLEVDGYGAKFEPKDVALLPVGAYDPQDFVPSLPQEQVEDLWREFHANLETVENPQLVRLSSAIFGRADIADAYKTHPSGVWHHHSYLGGNLQHVVGIQRIVDAVCRSYPEIDRDVVLFGAAVHDLGKLREYRVTSTIEVTDEGRLRGHLVIGAEWLAQIIAQLRHDGYDFSRSLEAHLVHMILSHHLKGEWGSPKPPATPEAMLLHMGDYADSQTKGFLQFMERNQGSADGWAHRKDDGQFQWVRVRRDWDE